MFTSFSTDMRDIYFALFDELRIQDLTAYQRYAHLDREAMEVILSKAERLAVEMISPLNSVADRTHPIYEQGSGSVRMPKEFHKAFRLYAKGGWISGTLEKSMGGGGMPESLGIALREIFNGACGGFYAFSSLTGSAMNLIAVCGTADTKKRYLENMACGRFTGTMCLTEPESGSYLSDIRTTARRDGGAFKIKGTKSFIGTGEHDLSENIIHCVLARIEGAPRGYKGISLFVVPKCLVKEDGSLGPRNDVFCSGIENKMGWDGAPTATLHFGDNDECQGWLLGEEGQGLAIMFNMINEMRLATAAQGVGQAAAAYRIALAFTTQRVQGLSYLRRKENQPDQVPIIQHPDIRRNLLFMKSVVEGCRRLTYHLAYYIDQSRVARDAKKRQYYEDLATIMTPICKAYSTDMGFRVAETAMQCMGGYGYTKDYGVEQYLRDLKVACIYEGTNGIQAIDLTRRSLNIKDGRLLQNLTNEIALFIKENIDDPDIGASISQLKKAKDLMTYATVYFTSKRKTDPGLRLSVAKPFLDLTGHVLCTWMLLKSAIKANSYLKNKDISNEDRSFYEGRVLTARFAVSTLLPQAEALARIVRKNDRSVLEIKEESF